MINTSEKVRRRRTLADFLLEAAAVGCLMGLTEVCWALLLPVIFPGRRYALPVSEIFQFIAFAVTTDALIVLLISAMVGTFVWLIRRTWRRADGLRSWRMLKRAILLSAACSYLFVAYCFTYYFGGLGDGSSAVPIAASGVLAIIFLSLAIAWALETARRRLGKTAPTAIWAVAVVFLLGTIAFNYFKRIPPIGGRGESPIVGIEKPPNILLVTLDTCRVDYIGCYGNHVVQTPTVDALGADGVVFENAIAQAPRTTPSHCSIMTSTYAGRHTAVNGAAMRADLPTLAEILQFNGYETGAFVSCNMVRSTNSGLHVGFDYYEDSMSLWTPFLRHDSLQFVAAFYLMTWLQNNQIPGYVVSDRAIEWLENRTQDVPFFCWVHYYDPHGPYAAPEPYTNMYAGQLDPNLPYLDQRVHYAGEITYADAQLGRVIEILKKRGYYDDMLIIVTADHGEAFGETHGDVTEKSHGAYLYYTTQHVPLIVKRPRREGAGRRIEHLVQLIDISPTVLELMDATPLPESFQGRSFGDLLASRQRDGQGVAYAERGLLPVIGQLAEEVENRRLMSMQTPQIKYICNSARDQQELYEIQSDPTESRNVFAEKMTLVDSCYAAIMQTLGAEADRHAAATDVDPRVLEQLKALGYLGSGVQPEAEDAGPE